jgi:predicted PurR-regulated permease PerM
MPLQVARSVRVGDVASGLIVGAILIALLYLGREILEPLVIAGLLGFILAPAVRLLRRCGLGRIFSVLLMVLLAIAAISALGSTIVIQMTQLAAELPRYEENLRAKIRMLSGIPMASGAVERATGTLRHLQSELARTDSPASTSAPERTLEAPSPPKPIPVEVRQPEPTGLEAIGNLVRPLLSPLTTSALVVLFLLFILLQREDIRDRFLRLAGTSDLQRSTAALNDAAARLSRFFLMQTLLNTAFAVVITAGLALIGVPNAVLWGILAGLMRFVPFIGSFIAAFFPIAIAAAVDPGWTLVLWTAALFIVAEPLAGHVVEPLLYGQHTGLSPVAIVLASLFWTMLWGPIGLLLATPLTVCLVVLGKHVDALNFIDVLLGDEPALEPEQRFYQRVLAGDATEAAEQAEEQLGTQALSTFYDTVAMKALVLAQADAAQGKLPREKQLEIRDTIEEIIDDLSDYSDEAPAGKEAEAAAPEQPPDAQIIRLDQGPAPNPVLCVASRSPLDEAAAAMLAHVLGKHGITAQVQPFQPLGFTKGHNMDMPEARLVCLSYFGAAARPAHVRYLIRRLKRSMPHASFLACFWMLGEAPAARVEEWRALAGADFAATSIAEATAICIRELTAAPAQPLLGKAAGRG